MSEDAELRRIVEARAALLVAGFTVEAARLPEPGQGFPAHWAVAEIMVAVAQRVSDKVTLEPDQRLALDAVARLWLEMTRPVEAEPECCGPRGLTAWQVQRSRETAWSWATAPDSGMKRSILATVLPDLPEEEAQHHYLAAWMMRAPAARYALAFAELVAAHRAGERVDLPRIERAWTTWDLDAEQVRQLMIDLRVTVEEDEGHHG